MFSGLVEEIGFIVDIIDKKDYKKITIKCLKILQDLKIGDSIAINGCCQTVVAFDNTSFTVETYQETLNKTNFKLFNLDESINLERSLKLSDRLGGHIVSGHVEDLCKIKYLKTIDNNTYLKVEIKRKFLLYFLKEGSITLDGISLTIADIEDNIITINIIDHTLKNTNLQYKNEGDYLNLESDILAKYILNALDKYKRLDLNE